MIKASRYVARKALMHTFVLKCYPMLKFAWRYRYPLLAIMVLGMLFLRSLADIFISQAPYFHSIGLMFISLIGVYTFTMTIRIQHKNNLQKSVERPTSDASN